VACPFGVFRMVQASSCYRLRYSTMAHGKYRGINEAFYLWWPPPVARVACGLTLARPVAGSFIQVSRRELSCAVLGSHPDIGNSRLTGLTCLACALGCFTQRKQPILHAPAVSRSKLFWPKADQVRQRSSLARPAGLSRP
jgi:hypothetical protein